MKNMIAILCVLMLTVKIFSSCCPTSGSIIPWSSYTYFYLDDRRPNGTGKANCQNALAGLDYFFTPCFFASLYGAYENTKNTSPLVGVNPPIRGERGYLHIEGTGGGISLNYLFSSGLEVYVDGSYLSYRQNLTSRNKGADTDFINNTRGHRWDFEGGVFYTFPTKCVTFIQNINYFYTSNHVKPSIDQFGNILTKQGAQFGSVNATTNLLFFPCFPVNLLVLGGLGYDSLRNVTFPISGIGPTQASFPLRPRFGWNVGAGIVVAFGRFSLFPVYVHTQRSGPIYADSVTIYGEMKF